VFTGIVEELGTVSSVPVGKMVIAARKILSNLQNGGSIAVNGVCLTVTDFDSKSFSIDVMPETLRRSNLGLLKARDPVNLERPLALGGELGGHLVQGHVDDTGRITSILNEGEALLASFEASPEILRYIVLKGFIAVDGVSLTVAEKGRDSFTTSIVGYTRTHTILGSKKVGDIVNLEVDIFAKYVEQTVRPRHADMTADFLREHGFMVN
jgi:riboflavin synthase